MHDLLMISKHPSCLGLHGDLDAGLTQGRRTQELREVLVASLDAKTLWTDYGIVASVIVSIIHFCSVTSLKSTHQPYTNSFPRADIHELLSGDLLHQIIKPFKDHVVDWILEWLTIEYGNSGAAVIVSEIDRR